MGLNPSINGWKKAHGWKTREFTTMFYFIEKIRSMRWIINIFHYRFACSLQFFSQNQSSRLILVVEETVCDLISDPSPELFWNSFCSRHTGRWKTSDTIYTNRRWMSSYDIVSHLDRYRFIKTLLFPPPRVAHESNKCSLERGRFHRFIKNLTRNNEGVFRFFLHGNRAEIKFSRPLRV